MEPEDSKKKGLFNRVRRKAKRGANGDKASFWVTQHFQPADLEDSNLRKLLRLIGLQSKKLGDKVKDV
jgi:hypothetical protein